MTFKEVGKSGERYPQWVLDLAGKSGAYLIKVDGVLAYIGESHTGSLYETSTRHFQRWTRSKAQDREYSKHDPGLTYPRGRCTMAAVICHKDKAIALQDRLIAKMKPRDNIAGAPDDSDVPF